MEEFLNEINQREDVFKFIKEHIELEAQKLYTKRYSVDFLFKDFVDNRLSDVILHFSNSIDENQVKRFSKELAKSFSDFNNQNDLYVQKNRLESLLEK